MEDTALATTRKLIWAYWGNVPQSGIGDYYFLTHHFAWLITSGSGELSFESGASVSLRPGTWYLPSPAIARKQRFSTDARLLSIRFKVESPDGGSLLSLADCVSFNSGDVPLLTDNARKLVQLTRGHLDGPLNDGIARKTCFERVVATEAVFLTWLSLLLKALRKKGIRVASQENGDPRAQKMIHYLNNVTMFSLVPYSRLNALSHLGRVQIDRLFKAETGLSPQQFMNRNLLAISQERIALSNLTLKELADELGFSSASRFCAWFRRNTGMTPGQFRELERESY